MEMRHRIKDSTYASKNNTQHALKIKYKIMNRQTLNKYTKCRINFLRLPFSYMPIINIISYV